MQFHTIKDVLIFWRESHSAMPLTWFAKRVGVSSSTLQRIFDGTTKLPDFITGRSICLNAIKDQNEAVKVLETLYPEKKKLIAEEAKSLKEIEYFNEPGLLAAHRDFYKWQILNLASIAPIPSKQLEGLGRAFSTKATELVKDGLLISKDDVYISKINLGLLISGQILTETVGYLARALKEKSDRGEPDRNGQVFYDIDGYSEIGKIEANNIILESAERILSLKKASKNRGNLPIAVMMTLSDFV